MINRDTIQAMNTAFELKYLNAQNEIASRSIHSVFCTPVGDEAHSIVEVPFLEQFGAMREWLGDRQVQSLGSRVVRIVERGYESTVGIRDRDIETGAWKLRAAVISALGQGAEELWDQLFVEALCANGNWIDDKPFFSASRKYGDGKKAAAINNYSTSDLTADNFASAYVAMQSYCGAAGSSLRVVPSHILVGPALEDVAKEIFESEKIKDSEGNEVNNPHRGKCTIVKTSELVGKYAKLWFLADCRGAIKPCAIQQSRKGRLDILAEPTSQGVFERGEALFGTSAYGAAAPVMPHMMYRGGAVVEA